MFVKGVEESKGVWKYTESNSVLLADFKKNLSSKTGLTFKAKAYWGYMDKWF